jgi:hypothetical protein
MLGHFSAKVVKEDSLKPTVYNKSLHEISNNNGVRVINFATSKNLTVIRSHIAINLLGRLLMVKPSQIDYVQKERKRHSSVLNV